MNICPNHFSESENVSILEQYGTADGHFGGRGPFLCNFATHLCVELSGVSGTAPCYAYRVGGGLTIGILLGIIFLFSFGIFEIKFRLFFYCPKCPIPEKEFAVFSSSKNQIMHRQTISLRPHVTLVVRN